MKKRITLIVYSIAMMFLTISDAGANDPSVKTILPSSKTNSIVKDLSLGLIHSEGALVSLPCYQSRNASLNEDGFFKIDPLTIVTNPEMPFDRYTVDIMGPLTDTFFCEHVGQEFQVMVTDNIDNISCWTLYTVEDKLAPALDCTQDTLPCNVDIDSLDFRQYVDANDNCTSEADLDFDFFYELQDFGCHPMFAGMINVNWTVTDESGRSATCLQHIYLEKAPIDSVMFPDDVTLSCPDVNIDMEFTGVPTIFGMPFDHFCDLYTFVTDETGPGCGDEQVITRTFMVMDLCNSGNMKTGTQRISIVDTLPPVLTCPDSTSVGTDQQECEGLVTIPDVDVEDACSDDASITIKVTIDGVFGTFHPGDQVMLETGDYVLTYVATDVCNNADTCNSMISVVDNSEPNVVCHNFKVTLGPDGEAVADTSSFSGFITDNCGEVEIRIRRLETTCIGGDTNFDTEVLFCCDDVGDTVMVEASFTDESGNEQFCMVGVYVDEKTPPVARCQDITVNVQSNGEVIIDFEDVDNGSTDNCGIETRVVDPNVFTCDHVGMTVPVQYIVTDFAGQSDTCTANVTVEANGVTNLSCIDITVTLDDNDNVTVTSDMISSTTMSDCDDNLEITPEEVSYDCDDIGDNNVMVELFVGGVLEATCVAVVTVESGGSTNAICEDDFSITLDQNGEASITVDDIDAGSTVACGVLGSSIDMMDFDCDDIGPNTVTLTITEDGVPVDNCTTIVTVNSDGVNMANCVGDFDLELGPGGTVSITADDIDAGSTVECGTLSLMINQSTFDCDDIGANDVILTVFEDGVAVASCTTVVTITDPETPMAVCQDFTLDLDEDGDGSISPNDVDGGSSIGCGIFALSVTPNVFDCDQAGTVVPVVLTVDNSMGQTDQCTAQVTVVDPFQVGISCPDDVTMDADELNGCDSTFVNLPPAVLTTSNPTAIITNNSPFAQSGGADASGFYPVGSTVVTFTAMDNCGAPVTCTTTITIVGEDTVSFSCIKQIFSMDSTTFIFTADDGFVVFDEGTCGGSAEDFELSFTPDLADDEPMIVTCDSLDLSGNWEDLFAVYVFEPNGDTTICNVGARVLDVDSLCAPFSSPLISGDIELLSSVSTVNTSISLEDINQGTNQEIMVGNDMSYDFVNMQWLETYKLQPYNNEDHLSGVTALDMVAIRRHLLGIEELATPYHYMAADVNESGTISIADILEIQRALLQFQSDFPNSTSWKFVDSKYEFPEVGNPLAEEIPNYIMIDPLADLITDADFKAVKTGDVNFDMDELDDDQMSWRGLDRNHKLRYPSIQWQENEQIEIPLYGNIEDVEALQLELGFHSGVLELQEVTSEVLDGFSDANVSYFEEDKGKIRIVWLAEDIIDIEDDQALFVLKFRTRRSGSSQGMLRLGNSGFASEVYHSSQTIGQMEIEMIQGEVKYELHQNVPNPFSEETLISYYLPERTDVTLSFYSIQGNLLFEKKQKGVKGENQFAFKERNADSHGVMIYCVESKYGKISRKMTLLH